MAIREPRAFTRALKKATRRNVVRQRRLGPRKVDDRNSPLNPLSIRAAAPMTRRWFPAALRRREKERESARYRGSTREKCGLEIRAFIGRETMRGERGGEGGRKVVVENVGSGSPTPKRNTRRSPRYTRGCVRDYASILGLCVRVCVCVCVYMCSADSTWRRGCPSRGTSR